MHNDEQEIAEAWLNIQAAWGKSVSYAAFVKCDIDRIYEIANFLRHTSPLPRHLARFAGLLGDAYDHVCFIENVGDVCAAVARHEYAIPATEDEWAKRIVQEYTANMAACPAITFASIRREETP